MRYSKLYIHVNTQPPFKHKTFLTGSLSVDENFIEKPFLPMAFRRENQTLRSISELNTLDDKCKLKTFVLFYPLTASFDDPLCSHLRYLALTTFIANKTWCVDTIWNKKSLKMDRILHNNCDCDAVLLRESERFIDQQKFIHDDWE